MACRGESGPPTSDVVSNIPWTVPEQATYNLVNQGGSQLAMGTLSVEKGEQDGTVVLRTAIQSGDDSDVSTVVVDAATLQPVSSRREIENDNPDDEDLIEVSYTEQGALIKVGDRQSGLKVEEHSYDNDTSLFLWRTIAFANGYEQAYRTIITNSRSDQKVILRVTSKEAVEVPAGEFECWRLEIFTSNAHQIAWFTDTPERTLVRYDNDRGSAFELTPAP
jgi:hypothetical protein